MQRLNDVITMLFGCRSYTKPYTHDTVSLSGDSSVSYVSSDNAEKKKVLKSVAAKLQLIYTRVTSAVEGNCYLHTTVLRDDKQKVTAEQLKEELSGPLESAYTTIKSWHDIVFNKEADLKYGLLRYAKQRAAESARTARAAVYETLDLKELQNLDSAAEEARAISVDRLERAITGYVKTLAQNFENGESESSGMSVPDEIQKLQRVLEKYTPIHAKFNARFK